MDKQLPNFILPTSGKIFTLYLYEHSDRKAFEKVTMVYNPNNHQTPFQVKIYACWENEKGQIEKTLNRIFHINHLGEKTGELTVFLPHDINNLKNSMLYKVQQNQDGWNGIFKGYVDHKLDQPDQLAFYQNNVREGEFLELDI